MPVVTLGEVQKHTSPNDCWLVLNGKVYDFTKFAPNHPGGEAVITQRGGQDASQLFNTFHTWDMVYQLPPGSYKGDLHPDDLKKLSSKKKKKVTSEKVRSGDSEEATSEEVASEKKLCEKFAPDYILNVHEMIQVGRENLSEAGYAYIATGAQDEITLRENELAFHRIWLRPRVLIDVSKIDMRTRILGHKVALPIMFAPTALARLATPMGETAYIQAARQKRIIKILPTLASMKAEEMFAKIKPDQTVFYQLYVNPDRKKTKRIVQLAYEAGCKAIVITVDAPGLGRRERDLRIKYAPKSAAVQDGGDRSKGTSNFLSSFIDCSITWADLEVFKTWTKLPLVLKGIQTREDAIRAANLGYIKAIVVTNHGGRQVDFGRAGIEILPEVIDGLRSVGALGRMEVWVDGGFRRGIDVFKALAIGATAVLIGRPMIFGAAAYGQAGVERVVEIFGEELQTCMRNCGCPAIKDITPSHVDISSLRNHTVNVPKAYARDRAYIPLGKL